MQAKNALKTLEAGITLGRNMIASGAGAAGPEDRVMVIDPLMKSATKLLDGVSVSAEADTVRIKLEAADVASLLPSAALANKMRSSASRNVSVNNLKQIGLAMHNYADINKKFPAAAAPEKGSVHPVSWRVRILPYIEQEALYKAYRMDEPWDGPNNRMLLDRMPRIYADPRNPSKSETVYRVFTGKSTIFPGADAVGIADITDGTSMTIMGVESAKTVPWTKPEDLPFVEGGPLPEVGGLWPEGFNVLFADGSVRLLSKTVPADTLRAMITRNGGEIHDGGGPLPARR
jgi:prepilin-type processing-associated H-X9-DG protein